MSPGFLASINPITDISKDVPRQSANAVFQEGSGRYICQDQLDHPWYGFENDTIAVAFESAFTFSGRLDRTPLSNPSDEISFNKEFHPSLLVEGINNFRGGIQTAIMLGKSHLGQKNKTVFCFPRRLYFNDSL